MFKRVVVVLVFLLSVMTIRAQVDVRDSTIAAFIPNFAYAAQIPAGDVAERYGFNSTIGGGLMYKTRKNVVFSADINFIFGNQVYNADSILSMVETESGHIIDGNGKSLFNRIRSCIRRADSDKIAALRLEIRGNH